MILKEIVRTCSNADVAGAALRSIGGKFAENFASHASQSNFSPGTSRCPHRETVRGERVNRGNGRRPRRDAWNRSAFACRLAAHSRGGCRCQIGLGKPTCRLAATGCPRERCSAISASLSHSSEKRIHSFGLIDKLARARQRSAVWRHVSGSMFGMGALRVRGVQCGTPDCQAVRAVERQGCSSPAMMTLRQL